MTNTDNKKIYDIIIVGTGFAGYTAGIYASRYKLTNVIFGDVFGGQTSEAHIIGNYPGFEAITGPELMQKVQEQAKKLGTEEIFERINSVKKDGDDSIFHVKSVNDKEYLARAVLLTIGMKRRKLQVPGEQKFYGKGVTYCATCDGFFYRKTNVAVIGGGDAATTAALFMAEIATHVDLVVRGSRLKGETLWIEKVQKHPNIKVHYNTKVKSFEGDTLLRKITLEGGDTAELTVDGAFIEIGSEPDTKFISTLGVETDEKGFIKVEQDQSTSLPGIFAAGDITSNSNHFEQLVTAASEAAIAVNSIEKMLRGN